jgi:hypothetical protein
MAQGNGWGMFVGSEVGTGVEVMAVLAFVILY